MGNSLGRAPVGRSDTGVTTGWTEGKPWEIAWGELRGGKERYGNDDRVDGREKGRGQEKRKGERERRRGKGEGNEKG